VLDPLRIHQELNRPNQVAAMLEQRNVSTYNDATQSTVMSQSHSDCIFCLGLMALPLTVSCFTEIQIGSGTGSPG